MTSPLADRPLVYNEEERKVIDPYKDAYMKSTSPAQRRTIAQVDIFPKLFTYWSKIGLVLTDEEENSRSAVSNY
jgi:hypothetical protein